MAAPMKRPREESENRAKKKISTDERLHDFLVWADKNEFQLSAKVTVGKKGSCAQYGMIAVADITEGDALFQVPRRMLLSPETSAISHLIQPETERLSEGSGWVPLLLALMYEYHNPDSAWRPYLDLTPDFNELDLPMFWPRSERESELLGTGVVEAVDKDLKSIQKEFESLVLPFVKQHPETFSLECEDLEFYKKMVAFVMAYSFTEPVEEEDTDDEGQTTPPPMMVPMADILNHVAKNNAHLSFEPDCLKMVATTDIKQGEEVYNTYGELPNWQLLQMYGFAEAFPLNHYDTVEVLNEVLFDHATDLPVNTEQLMGEKKTFLSSLNLLGSKSSLVIGVDGILTDEELQPVLKVLCADAERFAEFKESDGWSETEEWEDNSEDRYRFDHMKGLPKDWRLLLKTACKSWLGHYSKSEEEDTATMARLESLGATRTIFSFHTRHGQRKLLHQLIDSVS